MEITWRISDSVSGVRLMGNAEPRRLAAVRAGSGSGPRHEGVASVGGNVDRSGGAEGGAGVGRESPNWTGPPALHWTRRRLARAAG